MNKKKKFNEIPGPEKAALTAQWLVDKQASRIVLLDVQGLCSITDHIVVCSARSVKHAQSLADHLLEKCNEENIEFLGMEGRSTGEWVLVDMNDVIVHIFQNDLRDHYNIEGMWSEAERTDIAEED
ncbi:ribosome silencing factor [Salidesulfovibrio brasiliensis]|uniref:ribosome silencing factor n=1 Tax=Salidesulfovibrio brasiliensis TaxID=221711 RepID=UPI0006D28616|nr:ribosome silencing factor [Salidesulfovibrio brasiliensis]